MDAMDRLVAGAVRMPFCDGTRRPRRKPWDRVGSPKSSQEVERVDQVRVILSEPVCSELSLMFSQS
jgi:hypothetical protein